MSTLLETRALAKHYRIGSALRGYRTLRAVDGISLSVERGEILGLVGESGCGKSTLGRCMLRLTEITDGQILFDGRDISRDSDKQLRPLRPRMQMVFQDSYASLNPRRRVGDLIAEPLRIHAHPDGTRRTETEIAERLATLAHLVGLPETALQRYPHEFSGGQRQRINIARALALSPELIVADEPVSALDVSIQAQIVNLFMDLQESLGLTYVFVAHDLSVVRQIATRVAVMYLGAVVEIGPADTVLHAPAHPYTAALISAVPEPVVGDTARRITLAGDVPSPVSPPSGCRFHTRCPSAAALCSTMAPILRDLGQGREAACHFPLGG